MRNYNNVIKYMVDSMPPIMLYNLVGANCRMNKGTQTDWRPLPIPAIVLPIRNIQTLSNTYKRLPTNRQVSAN